ncbi:hypothetical protein LCGC14_1398360 [marine sediment metagenome]|uniref:Uncharacterized protein n=1 Tax=marine sediment metagenome TaxID=412755 RepID=A0A0F9KIP7_9ZZZZ
MTEWRLFECGEREWLIPFRLDSDEGELEFVALYAFPEESWLQHQIDNCGMEDWFSSEPAWEEALRLGIAPGQVFYARVMVDVTGGGYDEDWSADVVWREPISAFEAERCWEEWFVCWAEAERRRDDHSRTFAARRADPTTHYVEIGCGVRNIRHDTIELQLRSDAPAVCSDCCYQRKDAPLNSVTCANHGYTILAAIESMGWEHLPIAGHYNRIYAFLLDVARRCGYDAYALELARRIYKGGQRVHTVAADKLYAAFAHHDAMARLEYKEDAA